MQPFSDVSSYSQAGRAYIVDATAEEEACVDSAVQLAINGSGAVCGVFKRGPASVNPAVLQV